MFYHDYVSFHSESLTVKFFEQKYIRMTKHPPESFDRAIRWLYYNLKQIKSKISSFRRSNRSECKKLFFIDSTNEGLNSFDLGNNSPKKGHLIKNLNKNYLVHHWDWLNLNLYLSAVSQNFPKDTCMILATITFKEMDEILNVGISMYTRDNRASKQNKYLTDLITVIKFQKFQIRISTFIQCKIK